MEKIVSLCKRRGFIFPGSEIYGGLANTWDYGPYGNALKKNIKDAWWKYFVDSREDIVGLDSSIFMNPKVWEASGHLGAFSDPLIDCKKCKERFRGDKLIEENLGLEAAIGLDLSGVTKVIKDNKIKCPACGAYEFTEARNFNLMFKTHQGVVEEAQTAIYLRPETAQGIFVNFKNVLNTSRKKLPFGIAQIGKAFRNEITPGNFIFRTREFEQMEIEYFVKPDEKETKKLFDDWSKTMYEWFIKLGVSKENLRMRDHDADELSHYSSMTQDVEYKFPFGWGELAGLAFRGKFDLSQHEEFSKQDLKYHDPITNEKYLPHVIEPSFGADRTLLTFLVEAFEEEKLQDDESRTVMHFHPSLAPVKVAILPLMKKPELAKQAREIYDSIKYNFACEYDEGGNIGKRYRRQDEIGTPYCLTIDYDTLEKDKCVTIRDRDTMKQERIKIDKIKEYLHTRLDK